MNNAVTPKISRPWSKICRGELPWMGRMGRKALIASVIALGSIGAAQAQDAGPRLIGTGDDAQLVYPAPSRSLVGGGVASLTGAGDDAHLAYGGPTVSETQTGLVAELVGTGDNARLVYHAPAGSTSLLARYVSRPRD
jgi:ethanolamine utilization microcompartment shell protein EutL